MGRHKSLCATMGRPKPVAGIIPGSTEHKLLLAMRAPGGITAEQIANRFGYVSASLCRLRAKGLIVMPAPGQKGQPVSLTDAGREITGESGPLNRAKTLITYCQL